MSELEKEHTQWNCRVYDVFIAIFCTRWWWVKKKLDLPLGPYFSWYRLIWSGDRPRSGSTWKNCITSSDVFAWPSSMVLNDHRQSYKKERSKGEFRWVLSVDFLKLHLSPHFFEKKTDFCKSTHTASKYVHKCALWRKLEPASSVVDQGFFFLLHAIKFSFPP